MDGVKNIVTSKTFWGALAAIAGGAASFFGYSVDEATKQVIVDQGMMIGGAGATLVGGLLAIWGRIKANKKIG
jgi:hypothetical protein